MNNDAVLHEKKNHITYITLNRPESHNSMNVDTLDQLSATLLGCKRDDDCRAIIVTGAGDKFSAGADLSVFIEVMPTILGVREWSRYGQEVFSLFDGLGKPSIAAVNGLALGGGFELALACTFRIASQNARFGFSEMTLGFIPGWGGISRIARLAGTAKAADLLLTGRRIDAQEALEAGVVNDVVPPGALLSTSETLAGKIIRNSPVAVRLAMEALHCAGDLTFDEALKTESNLAGLVCHSEDAKEGLTAYIEKRDAQFLGK